jgi:hypothetical protein
MSTEAVDILHLCCDFEWDGNEKKKEMRGEESKQVYGACPFSIGAPNHLVLKDWLRGTKGGSQPVQIVVCLVAQCSPHITTDVGISVQQ